MDGNDGRSGKVGIRKRLARFAESITQRQMNQFEMRCQIGKFNWRQSSQEAVLRGMVRVESGHLYGKAGVRLEQKR